MPSDSRMISLGFGKFARADRIYALEPLLGDERGDGRRTRVWVDGIPDPIIASRTEGTQRSSQREGARVSGWSELDRRGLARPTAAQPAPTWCGPRAVPEV